MWWPGDDARWPKGFAFSRSWAVSQPVRFQVWSLAILVQSSPTHGLLGQSKALVHLRYFAVPSLVKSWPPGWSVFGNLVLKVMLVGASLHEKASLRLRSPCTNSFLGPYSPCLKWRGCPLLTVEVSFIFTQETYGLLFCLHLSWSSQVLCRIRGLGMVGLLLEWQ